MIFLLSIIKKFFGNRPDDFRANSYMPFLLESFHSKNGEERLIELSVCPNPDADGLLPCHPYPSQ
jgi:hypothetical protein